MDFGMGPELCGIQKHFVADRALNIFDALMNHLDVISQMTGKAEFLIANLTCVGLFLAI